MNAYTCSLAWQKRIININVEQEFLTGSNTGTGPIYPRISWKNEEISIALATPWWSVWNSTSSRIWLTNGCTSNKIK